MVKIAFNYQGLQQGLTRDASREQGTSVSLKDISDRFGAGLVRRQQHSKPLCDALCKSYLEQSPQVTIAMIVLYDGTYGWHVVTSMYGRPPHFHPKYLACLSKDL